MPSSEPPQMLQLFFINLSVIYRYICSYIYVHMQLYIYIYAFSNRVTNIESFERIIRN